MEPHHDTTCKQNPARSLCSRLPRAETLQVTLGTYPRPQAKRGPATCSWSPSATPATGHHPGAAGHGPQQAHQLAKQLGEESPNRPGDASRVQAPHVYTTAGPPHGPSKVLRVAGGSSTKPWGRRDRKG